MVRFIPGDYHLPGNVGREAGDLLKFRESPAHSWRVGNPTIKWRTSSATMTPPTAPAIMAVSAARTPGPGYMYMHGPPIMAPATMAPPIMGPGRRAAPIISARWM